jgi:hypothetical protein
VRDYLLARDHFAGRSKARFFASFGFSRDNWVRLSDALLLHREHGQVTGVETTPYGQKYVVEGTLQSPDGRDPWIRSVWFDDGERLTFVTAYPARERTDDR